jgi:cytoskeleton protein RodZ
MNHESIQETLFADPVGLRFRHAREGKRWSREVVAQQLKLPVAVIEAMEREDWDRLGAPIYARSYVASYARLLEMPASVVDEIVRAPRADAPLMAMGGVPAGKRMVDRSLVNLGYLAITLAIVGSVVMLAMHFQSPAGNPEVLSLASPAGEAGTVADASSPAGAAPNAAATTNPPPVLASMAPGLPAAPEAATMAVAADEIVLRFRGESWVDLVDASGTHFERGLVAAGSERRFKRGQLAHATLGNADAVEVLQGGQVLDLGAFRQANIARFAVSSDGKLAPPGG